MREELTNSTGHFAVPLKSYALENDLANPFINDVCIRGRFDHMRRNVIRVKIKRKETTREKNHQALRTSFMDVSLVS